MEDLLGRAFAAAGAALAPGAALYVCHPAGPHQLSFLQAFVGQGWDLRQTLVWVKDAMVLGHGTATTATSPSPSATHPARDGGDGAAGDGTGNDRDSVLEVPAPPRLVVGGPASPPGASGKGTCRFLGEQAVLDDSAEDIRSDNSGEDEMEDQMVAIAPESPPTPWDHGSRPKVVVISGKDRKIIASQG